MSKRAVVCGQGACTAFLLSGLLEKKYKVTVIAEDPEFCRKMAEETDSRVILGDPGSPEVLEDAGIRGSQVILALGKRDEDNLEICQMGTKLFGIGRCICLVHNPRNKRLFEQLGVDQAVSLPLILAQAVEEEIR